MKDRQKELERHRVYSRNYRKNNPEKAERWHKAHMKERNAKASPEYRMYHNAKSRAKKFGLDFTIELKDIVSPEFCPALGIPLKRAVGRGANSDFSPSLDRLIPSLGYVRGNVVVLSKKANQIKNNATVYELEKIAQWLRRDLVSRGMA